MSEKLVDIRKAWTNEEDEAIKTILEQIGTKNWPLVSQLMKEKYHLPNRSGKQCRQRWHNQLNPQLNKKPWAQEQQQKLFQAHRKYGNRWIQISKLFGGRTDNSIKNHFYSTIRRSMRRICKLLGNRNSTSKLRNIRPSVLSQIFQFSKTQHMKQQGNLQNMDIASCLLQYARQKPRKISDFDPDSKTDLQNLVGRLIILNDQYVSYKSKKKILSQCTKKSIRYHHKQRSKKSIASTQYQSQTNSFPDHPSIFEKQHNEEIEQQNNQSNFKELPYQQDSLWSQNDQNEILYQETLPKIQLQQYENEYLKITHLPIPEHFYMFASTNCFSQKQNQCFQNLKQPSFCQIGFLEHAFISHKDL